MQRDPSTQDAASYKIGSRVESGDTVEDYDCGTIQGTRANPAGATEAWVSWDSCVKTWADIASLRRVGTRVHTQQRDDDERMASL